MGKDSLYFYTLLGAFSLIITLLIKVMIKFSRLSAFHLLEACKQFIASLSGSAFHFFGTGVTTFILGVIAILITKSLISLISHYLHTRTLCQQALKPLPKQLALLAKKHHIPTSRLVIIRSDQKQAFSFGLVRSKIIISTGLINNLTTKELEAVILHELAHLKYHHSVKFFISRLLTAGLFFLPVINQLANKFYLAAESRADRFAINQQQNSRHLKTALIKLAFADQAMIYPSFGLVKSTGSSMAKRLASPLIIGLMVGLYFLPLHVHKPNNNLTHLKPLTPNQGCHHTVNN